MNATLTDSQFKVSREDFLQRLETENARNREVQAVYASHMSKVAHYLYLAGEAVKRKEFGYAESQHRFAAMSMDAALKALPVGERANLLS